MAKYILKSIGLYNPTEIERRGRGIVKSVISVGLGIDEMVCLWRDKFYDFGETGTYTTIFTSQEILNLIKQKRLDLKSIADLFYSRGIVFKEEV